MDADFFTVFLGFLEGFALILSPCILPILPIFLAGSLSGSKLRPYGIIIGFTLFFALVAFFSRRFVAATGIDLNLIRHLSFLILFILGVVMLSDYLTEKIAKLTNGLTKIGTYFSYANSSQAGFINGLFFGGLIAIVWTPCAGPILATVIVQTVMQKTSTLSFIVLLAFALGAALPMLIISLYGHIVIKNLPLLKTNPTLIRKILGGLILISVLFMVYLEEVAAAPTGPQTQIKTSSALIDGVWFKYKAPPIAGISDWINSPPLTINSLKGKVVLIDFWTYSCINCLRTLPYLKEWYQRYKDKGFVIIGVHSPEFDFEKNLANVKAAVTRDGILYPVALDNNFSTWTQYQNHYWPAHYLIDKNGMVVYKHFGEGEYAVTESNIRYLLGMNDLKMLDNTNTEPLSFNQTPETYLGYGRADAQFSPPLLGDKIAAYHFPTALSTNSWALEGLWRVNKDSVVAASSEASLKIHFNARKVFIVMGTETHNPVKIKVLLNGELLLADKGKDVIDSSVLVDKDTIYELVVQKQSSSGYLQIIATQPGVKIYTFTFGS